MKKLIRAATFTLVFALPVVPAALAGGIVRDVKAPHIVHSGAHPNDARVLSATHHFEVHVQGSKLSQLFIYLPEDIKVRGGIQVTDESSRKVDATVSMNGKKATVTFTQPVSPETTLTVSLKGVQAPAPGYARTLVYPVYSNSVGTASNIRLGLANIKTYE